MAILLKGGTVVRADGEFNADVRIEGEKIAGVGEISAQKGDEVLDARGKFILPGAIDVHTHLSLDCGAVTTADDFATGTRAALAGGTTCIIDFVNHIKGTSFEECVRHYHSLADGKCFCDWGFHLGVSDWNAARSAEIERIVAEEGITSFKMYMAYKGTMQVSDEEIEAALKKAKKLGVLFLFHCENGDIVAENVARLLAEGKTSPEFHPISRGDDVELDAVRRLIDISDKVGHPVYIVHLSSKKALEEVRRRRKNGSRVICETCPQYLVLTDSLYKGAAGDDFAGAKAVLSPPLRKKADNDALWQALAQGDVQTVATDHCSFTYAQKKVGLGDFSKIPNGGAGIEHRLQILYSEGVAKGKISLPKLVELTAESPAKIFALFPQKGIVAEGADADISVVDFDVSEKISAATMLQNLDYTLYEGFDAKMRFLAVFSRGKKMVWQGKFVGSEQSGKFLKRECQKMQF